MKLKRVSVNYKHIIYLMIFGSFLFALCKPGINSVTKLSFKTHFCSISSKACSTFDNPFSIELEEDDVDEDEKVKDRFENKLFYTGTGNGDNLNTKILNSLNRNLEFSNKINSFRKINFLIFFNVFRI